VHAPTQQTLLALQGSALDPFMRSQHRGGIISLVNAPPPWIVQLFSVLCFNNCIINKALSINQSIYVLTDTAYKQYLTSAGNCDSDDDDVDDVIVSSCDDATWLAQSLSPQLCSSDECRTQSTTTSTMKCLIM